MSGGEEASALIAAAREARKHAHAPYSRFAVGAAALLADGGIVTGANLENASYGLSLCAEAAALTAANSAGRLADVVALAVAGGPIDGVGRAAGERAGEAIVRPCGRCRQLLAEAAAVAGRDLAVHCAGAQGEASETHLLSALLPFAFSLAPR